ncbi:MAG: hypothetical protein ACREOZ_03745, partial [Gloeomargaritales cyanobacterium]
ANFPPECGTAKILCWTTSALQLKRISVYDTNVFIEKQRKLPATHCFGGQASRRYFRNPSSP